MDSSRMIQFYNSSKFDGHGWFFIVLFFSSVIIKKSINMFLFTPFLTMYASISGGKTAKYDMVRIQSRNALDAHNIFLYWYTSKPVANRAKDKQIYQLFSIKIAIEISQIHRLIGKCYSNIKRLAKNSLPIHSIETPNTIQFCLHSLKLSLLIC